MDEGQLIARIERNKATEIRIRLVEFGGRPFVDVRNFVDVDDGHQRVPTRKGIAIPPGLVGEVIAALTEAGAQAVGDQPENGTTHPGAT